MTTEIYDYYREPNEFPSLGRDHVCSSNLFYYFFFINVYLGIITHHIKTHKDTHTYIITYMYNTRKVTTNIHQPVADLRGVGAPPKFYRGVGPSVIFNLIFQ